MLSVEVTRGSVVESTHLVRAPVKARMVVPVQMIPGLIAALQENFRLYQESFGAPKGPLH